MRCRRASGESAEAEEAGRAGKCGEEGSPGLVGREEERRRLESGFAAKDGGIAMPRTKD